MLSPWQLPTEAQIGARRYSLHTDFREILRLMAYLEDPDRPEFLRWQIALNLFYDGEIPRSDAKEAMAFLADFLTCGEPGRPGPKRVDWRQDAAAIISDINKVAGTEIRSLPYLHWWTFLSYFHAIGEGQLSALVTIRDKLRRGKPLDGWERRFYQENKERVDLKPRYSAQERQERDRIKALLDEGEQKSGNP